MSNRYLMRYKGKYRLLPVIDQETNDFPRTPSGDVEEDIEIYITCQYDNRIYAYGTDGHKEMQLAAYIPSLGRGRNIRKTMDKEKIEYYAYDETDEEVRFVFSAKDIEKVASLLKAKTGGANISPMSKRNLPKDKSVQIPDEDMKSYKDITSGLDKNRMFSIKSVNKSFMDNVLAKRLKENPRARKPFDYKADMRRLMLAGKTKEYIWVKGLWKEYIDYLNDNL
jgi:hypothetical protein